MTAQTIAANELVEEAERDLRIAIWNAAMKGGMGQNPSQAFIRRAMDEPGVAKVLATITRLTDELEGVKEQCARIAEGWTSPLKPGTDARLLGYQEAARAIAAAIRSEHHDAAHALLGGRE